MNHLNTHPVFATLANTASDIFSVELDDKELERVMDRDNSILGVRVVTAEKLTLPATKEITGTLTSRLRTLANETEGFIIQKEFRDQMEDHPAYILVVEEIRDAYANGTMFDLFDSLEKIGVIAAYSKKGSTVSLGLNPVKMNMGVREHKRMFSSSNKRSLDFVNSEGGVLNIGKVKEEVLVPSPGISTTFYLTFKV